MEEALSIIKRGNKHPLDWLLKALAESVEDEQREAGNIRYCDCCGTIIPWKDFWDRNGMCAGCCPDVSIP